MPTQLPAKSTIANCEKALASLSASSKEASSVVIPTNFKQKSMGAEISWVQFLVTWVKRQKSLKLLTYATKRDDKQIEKFTKQLIGTVASLCATEVRSNRSDATLTEVYKKSAFERLDNLQTFRPDSHTLGPNVEVVAGDDFARNTPASLYPSIVDGKRKLGNRVHFMRTAARLIEATVPNDRIVNNDIETRRAIGTLLYETYKNTEDHSKYDIVGNVIEHSYRILQASFTGILPENLRQATEGYEPLEMYIRKFQPTNGKKQLTFLSFSVLDSGPGFAQTITSTPIDKLDRNEELEATLSCFTTKSRRKRLEYGKGLQIVREYLQRKRGFLRVRTGRVSLFYDGCLDVDLEAPIPLENWTNNEDDQVAHVEGALLTMHLPIGDTR